VGIDYGVYGVPETYVIDQAGIIRYKHVGPVTPDVVQTLIDPLLKGLK
jgi:cytochrome c biogenesis protein CcmG/thiol:disulfide interchange protein DsbE